MIIIYYMIWYFMILSNISYFIIDMSMCIQWCVFSNDVWYDILCWMLRYIKSCLITMLFCWLIDDICWMLRYIKSCLITMLFCLYLFFICLTNEIYLLKPTTWRVGGLLKFFFHCNVLLHIVHCYDITVFHVKDYCT